VKEKVRIYQTRKLLWS